MTRCLAILSALLVGASDLAAQSRPVTTASAPAAPAASMASSQPAEKAATQYYALLMNGRKVGYAIHKRLAEGEKVTTTEMVELTISRGKTPITVMEKEVYVETADGKPLSFQSIQSMGMTQQVEGVIENGKINLTVTTSGTPTRQQMPWPKGAIMSEGARLLALQKGMAEGTTYTAQTFLPSYLTAIENQVTVGKRTSVDVLGHSVPAVEVKTVSESLVGGLTTTSYVDDDQEVIKTSLPMMGLVIEMISAPKSIALAKPEVFDALDAVAIVSPAPLENVKAAASATYVLSADKDKSLSLLESDYQAVRHDEADNTFTVTVKNAPPEGDSRIPLQDADAGLQAATQPGRYLQSDDAKVKKLAAQAVGNTTLASEAARKLEAFVAGYINKKDMTIGYASAAEVAQSREGDCTEHAVLLAAMCRAVGLPARTVCGVVYVPAIGGRKDLFLPHAWVEAYVGKEWIGLDAAYKGFDVGHIAFCHSDGNPEEFFNIVNTLGYFKITSAKVQP